MSKYFNPKEWLPKETYLMLEDTGKAQYADRYIDDRVLITADKLRSIFGPTFGNTWSLSADITKIYGIHNWRGWRPFNCKIGAEFSAHKFGQAMDLVFANIESKHVREYVLEKPENFPYITELETGINWFHYRVGIRNGEMIKLIHP